MAEFVMPQLGADMSAGKLLAWRKHVGENVQRGDIIADVETDKADIEVEVFTNGVIEKVLVQPGEKVPIGTVLAIIREEGKPSGSGSCCKSGTGQSRTCCADNSRTARSGNGSRVTASAYFSGSQKARSRARS